MKTILRIALAIAANIALGLVLGALDHWQGHSAHDAAVLALGAMLGGFSVSCWWIFSLWARDDLARSQQV